jgi:YHS domain-containing protein
MRLLILIILGYILYRMVKRLMAPKPKVKRTAPGEAVDELVKDPMCNTYVALGSAEKRVIRGKEYAFCSKACADRYEKEMKNQP